MDIVFFVKNMRKICTRCGARDTCYLIFDNSYVKFVVFVRQHVTACRKDLKSVSVEGRHLAHFRWAKKNCVSELHLPYNSNQYSFVTDHVLNIFLLITYSTFCYWSRTQHSVTDHALSILLLIMHLAFCYWSRTQHFVTGHVLNILLLITYLAFCY
jgi:hypothetical protein